MLLLVARATLPTLTAIGRRGGCLKVILNGTLPTPMMPGRISILGVPVSEHARR